MEYIRIGSMNLKNYIGSRVFVTFLARDVSVRLQKDKVTKFVVFNMVDKDTVIEARVFGANESMIELIQEGKVYDAAIDIKPYDKASDGYSCIVYNMDFSSIPPEYFADWATGLDKSKQLIESVLASCYDTYYGQITYPILIKHWNKFSKWTAASGQHHTQLGGLLTHTAEVVGLADVLSEYFNNKYGEGFINRPLLLCAAILHDIGKTYELDVNTLSGKTEYNTHSTLTSHIMDALTLVDIQAYELGFGKAKVLDDFGNDTGELKPDYSVEEEKEAIELLKHCLAAHHGKLEYGSPITASIPEAYLLNMCDLLSADMYKYNKALKSINPGDCASVWSQSGFLKYYKECNKLEEIEGDKDE